MVVVALALINWVRKHADTLKVINENNNNKKNRSTKLSVITNENLSTPWKRWLRQLTIGCTFNAHDRQLSAEKYAVWWGQIHTYHTYILNEDLFDQLGYCDRFRLIICIISTTYVIKEIQFGMATVIALMRYMWTE